MVLPQDPSTDGREGGRHVAAAGLAGGVLAPRARDCVLGDEFVVRGHVLALCDTKRFGGQY